MMAPTLTEQCVISEKIVKEHYANHVGLPNRMQTKEHNVESAPVQRPWESSTAPPTDNYTGLSPMNRWQAQAIEDEPWNNVDSAKQTRMQALSTQEEVVNELATRSLEGQAGSVGELAIN
jgi:hypothetical protein